MEPPLPGNIFCNWGSFTHWGVVHLEIKITNNDSSDKIISSHLSSNNYQNEWVVQIDINGHLVPFVNIWIDKEYELKPRKSSQL